MILAFDTYYFENKAKTVCLAFNNWADSEPSKFFEETISEVEDYQPGAFYKRELPCILSLLSTVRAEINDIHAIVIDGFVILDDQMKPGLGGYLFNELDSSIPVIGVAKSGFHSNKKNVKELLRGNSKKPLYITSLGIELDSAFEYINAMHGEYRMPTLLQMLDAKTKSTVGNKVYSK